MHLSTIVSGVCLLYKSFSLSGPKALPCVRPTLTLDSPDTPGSHSTLLFASSYVPSTNLTSPSGTPTHLSVPIIISLGIVAQAFSRYMNLIAISSCPSSFFSTNYLWANIPCVVPLPCLNSSCSSPISRYTIALILPSRFFPATSTYGLATYCLKVFPGHAHLPFFFIFGKLAPFFIPL
ncbi:hypothetical protein NP493_1085g00040 [Ridgeia piscesae]|uniref:Uncharacterized protein n=1 Tax=Ridgeia piscesae TaxID=27915 RepID=A0AAD9NJX0_RIDPI|nr:hypothetical protein NP493_1085g00040 [Ridgeia piscesae]